MAEQSGDTCVLTMTLYRWTHWVNYEHDDDVERMADDRLPERAAELREYGRRRRSRETKAEMGGREEGRIGGRLEEEDNYKIPRIEGWKD